VIWNEIQHDSDAERLCLCNQILKILHRAIIGLNCVIIRHIITGVDLRALENWTQPKRIKAGILQVVQSRNHTCTHQPKTVTRANHVIIESFLTLQISDAVASGVHEASRVDLIKGRRAPPLALIVLAVRGDGKERQEEENKGSLQCHFSWSASYNDRMANELGELEGVVRYLLGD
jgi:hypothetical protein